jgi:hypothetical protein
MSQPAKPVPRLRPLPIDHAPELKGLSVFQVLRQGVQHGKTFRSA